MAATFAEVWEGVASMVAEMDLLAGFAELAMCAPLPYVRPTMLPADAAELKLTACRCSTTALHPVSLTRMVFVRLVLLFHSSTCISMACKHWRMPQRPCG